MIDEYKQSFREYLYTKSSMARTDSTAITALRLTKMFPSTKFFSKNSRKILDCLS